jgi:ATP-dependent Clp protease ATP-binding subunit ClpA
MFERFTERARQAVVLAQEEAQALGHNYIGTEHILLGLAREGEGVAARILADLGAPPRVLAEDVLKMLAGSETYPAYAYSFASAVSPATTGSEAPFFRLRSVRRTVAEVTLVFGWVLFGVAFGLGLLAGWLIWG